MAQTIYDAIRKVLRDGRSLNADAVAIYNALVDLESSEADEVNEEVFAGIDYPEQSDFDRAFELVDEMERRDMGRLAHAINRLDEVLKED